MKETLLVQEFEKLRTAKRKGAEEQGDVGQSGGTRRTRSQAAPDWTAQDLLILVFEISAVEGECANALSSYQKWTMVAQNCAALDVARTSHQCRSKWESLLIEYKMILEWQKGKKGKSYWSLDSGRRKKAGLPLDFTEDLFKAIDEAVKVQGERSGSDPDTDTEAEFDAADSIETGSKKLRHYSTHHKEILEEEDEDEEEEEEDDDEDETSEMEMPRRSAPHKISTERENELQSLSTRSKAMNKGKGHLSTENQLQFLPISQEEFNEEIENMIVSDRANTEELEHFVLENESLCQFIPPNGNSEETEHAPVENKSCYQLSPVKPRTEQADLVQIVPFYQSNEKTIAKKKNGAEEKRQFLAAKIQENTELIHAIIAGNSGQEEDDNEEGMEMKRAREKADKLVKCIADMAKNLDLLNQAVKECRGNNIV